MTGLLFDSKFLSPPYFLSVYDFLVSAAFFLAVWPLSDLFDAELNDAFKFICSAETMGS